MIKEPLDPSISPPGGAYSAGLRFANLLFLAGQGPFDPISGALVGDSIEEQTRATIANIERLLTAAGTDLSAVLKTTVFLADFAYFDRFDAVYASYLPDPRPVRTTVAAGLGDILVEIDVIAGISPANART